MSAADVSALVIALREGVEMTLIVGIVLAYLTRIGARRAHRFVWAGVGAVWGLFLLAFFTVAREGVETALLLFAAPGEGKLFGAVVGFAIAIGIGVLIYVYGRRLDLATFFRVTGIMLIVFAAGLVT